MSTYQYGPALESEIGYRRAGLLQAAASARLARVARRARRAERREGGALRPVPAATASPAAAHQVAATSGELVTAGTGRDRAA